MSKQSNASEGSSSSGCGTPVRLPPELPPEPCCCGEDPIKGLKQLFVDYFQGRGMAAGRDPATRPVFLRPGIAVQFRGVEGDAAHLSAAAVRAVAGLAARVDEVRADPALSDLGRAQALASARTAAEQSINEAVAQIARQLASLEAQHAAAIVPPAAEGRALADDAEIRAVLHGMLPEAALAAVRDDPAAALAVLRGPRIGIPSGAIEVAQGVRIETLRRGPDFQRLESAPGHFRAAAGIAQETRRALDKFAPTAAQRPGRVA
jgi:hypothetical protein